MNRLAGLARRRPVTALVAGIIPLLLGVIAFFRLPVALVPAAATPALSVEVNYAGVGPEKIEEIITRPLEENLSAVGGIEQIFSTSQEGQAKINLEFSRATNIDLAALDVREKIDPVAVTFPREVQPPVVLRYDASRRPVMIITFESELPLAAQREIAERRVKKTLESVTGISEVLVAGGRQREILVDVNKTALEAHGLSLAEVVSQLGRFNLNRYAGEIEEGGDLLGFYTRGRFGGLDDIRAVFLRRIDGRPGARVRVGDIAKVSYGFRDPDSASRLNGEDRVSLFLYRAGRASLPALSREVHRRLMDLPGEGVKFSVRYDRARGIIRAFRFMGLALLFSLILVSAGLMTVFEFTVQETFLTLTVPIAGGLMTSLGLFLVGGQYDLVTVPGMILGSGFALLFAVNSISSMRASGAAAAAASAPGMNTVFLIVLAGFIPIMFAREDIRAVYSGITFAVLFMVGASIFWCLVVLPVLYRSGGTRLVFAGERERSVQSLREFLFQDVPAQILRMAKVDYSLFQVSVALGLVILVGLLAFRYSRFDYLNKFDKSRITGALEFPSGTSFAAANAGAKKVEAKLLKVEGVQEVTSRVEEARATIRLKLDREVDDDYIALLRKAAGSTEPAFLFFGGDGEAGDLKEIRVDVYGDDLDTLNRITRGTAKSAELIEGVRDVVLRYKSPRPELRLRVDKVRAESAGVDVARIGENVRIAIQGGIATRMLEKNREIDVRVRLDRDWRRNLDRLKEYGIKANEERFVPLFELVRPEKGNVPPKIFRRNKKRSLSFSVSGVGLAPAVLLDRLETIRSVKLAEGYRVEFGSEVQKYLESRRRLYMILALGFLLVFMSLAGMTESLINPLRLLAPVPLPVTISILVLFLAGIAISVPVLISFFLLAALVVFQSLGLEGEGANQNDAPAREARWRTETGSFLAASLILIGFYLPLTMIFAEGGEILRAVSLGLLGGILATAILTPALGVYFREKLK